MAARSPLEQTSLLGMLEPRSTAGQLAGEGKSCTPQQRQRIAGALDEILDRRTAVLRNRLNERRAGMAALEAPHHVLYGALGIDAVEAARVDEYQQLGRLVYAHLGGSMEALLQRLFALTIGGGPREIDNLPGRAPKRLRLDWVTDGGEAYELKWRDATTDGDHTRKERQKAEAIHRAGLIPVQLMWYEPTGSQSGGILRRVAATYREYGHSHIGTEAAAHVLAKTGFDLDLYLRTRADQLALSR